MGKSERKEKKKKKEKKRKQESTEEEDSSDEEYKRRKAERLVGPIMWEPHVVLLALERDTCSRPSADRRPSSLGLWCRRHACAPNLFPAAVFLTSIGCL